LEIYIYKNQPNNFKKHPKNQKSAEAYASKGGKDVKTSTVIQGTTAKEEHRGMVQAGEHILERWNRGCGDNAAGQQLRATLFRIGR
jgi:hypothetical protein